MPAVKTLELKVRATNPGADQNLKLASRVYISKDALIELTSGVEEGKLITIEKLSEDGKALMRREATVWAAPTKLVKVAQVGEILRSAYGYSIGDQVRISYSAGGAVPPAEEVIIKDITAPVGGNGDSWSFWEQLVARSLVHVETIFAGLPLKKLQAPPPVPVFTISAVNGSATTLARYSPGKTIVKVAAEKPAFVNGGTPSKLEITDIPGREPQVQEVNRFLRRFGRPPAYNRAELRAAGLIIHGTHGTGKSLFLDRIAQSGWGTVHRVQFKDKLSDIQETLAKARTQQPSIVLIDMLERLIDKERSNRGAVILALCDALDALAQDARTTGELPRVAVVATCLDHTVDVPADLRDPGRFTRDIYLSLPDVQCRKAILTSHNLPFQPEERDNIVQNLSERTHAYNAKDLRRLVSEALDLAEDLVVSEDEKNHLPEDAEKRERHLPPHVFDQALRRVRPTAMHDINLKPPPIRWGDIGGQDAVKTSLRQAVALSTAPRELLGAVIESPPRGFLLYGPPGCSKTMAAQAMATESGLNFFAVKGAELLNMYVGESERAVRRLFERAREASPSMIFFDEIDAIAGQRQGFGGSGAAGRSSSSSATSHGGLNVLTTLLNEMDGFETTRGVLVLAATNRPQALDPALLRPGRFDDLIYVSPPDREAREAIFMGVAGKRRLIDVDVAHLARETEGYSGAEIKGICAAAGRAAWQRYSEDPKSELGITMDDLKAAIANQKRQITEEMLRGYLDWESQFRRY